MPTGPRTQGSAEEQTRTAEFWEGGNLENTLQNAKGCLHAQACMLLTSLHPDHPDSGFMGISPCSGFRPMSILPWANSSIFESQFPNLLYRQSQNSLSSHLNPSSDFRKLPLRQAQTQHLTCQSSDQIYFCVSSMV